MIIDLTGRKAVVTGSTAGIGLAIAEGLGRAGAAVVINGRTDKRVSSALRGLRELLPKAEFTGVVADLATPRVRQPCSRRRRTRTFLSIMSARGA